MSTDGIVATNAPQRLRLNDIDESRHDGIRNTESSLHPLRRKRHEPVVPNVKPWRSEYDLVSVTQAGYAVEYEIKRMLADFKRDRDKRRDRFFRGTGRFKHRGHGPCRFF